MKQYYHNDSVESVSVSHTVLVPGELNWDVGGGWSLRTSPETEEWPEGHIGYQLSGDTGSEEKVNWILRVNFPADCVQLAPLLHCCWQNCFEFWFKYRAETSEVWEHIYFSPSGGCFCRKLLEPEVFTSETSMWLLQEASFWVFSSCNNVCQTIKTKKQIFSI